MVSSAPAEFTAISVELAGGGEGCARDGVRTTSRASLGSLTALQSALPQPESVRGDAATTVPAAATSTSGVTLTTAALGSVPMGALPASGTGGLAATGITASAPAAVGEAVVARKEKGRATLAVAVVGAGPQAGGGVAGSPAKGMGSVRKCVPQRSPGEAAGARRGEHGGVGWAEEGKDGTGQREDLLQPSECCAKVIPSTSSPVFPSSRLADLLP